MKCIPLSNQEAARSGFTHKIIIPYTDMTGWTSGTAYSVFPQIGTASAATGSATFNIGTRVRAVAANVSTAFTFAAGTLVFSLGDGGDAARFVAASTDLKTAGYITDSALTKKPYIYTAADTIDITVTAGAGTPATIAAGELHLFLALEDSSTTLEA